MPNNMTPLTAISQVIDEQLVELRYSDFPLLNSLRKQQAYQNNIRWNVNVSNAGSVGGRFISADANAAVSDDVVNANLAIGNAVMTKTVDLLKNDIQQAKTAGVGALKNLVDAHFRSQVIQLLRAANDSLFKGTGVSGHGGVYGFEAIADDTPTDPYAGIDSTTYTAWKPALVSLSATPRPLTLEMLNNCEVATYRSGTGNFTAVITTPEIVQKYTQLFAERLVNPGTVINGTADLGYSNVTYKGRPVMFDRHCPSGTMYFVDQDQFTIYTRDLKVNNEMETINANGLILNVSELPTQNMYAHKFEIGLALQLKCADRRALVKVENISI